MEIIKTLHTPEGIIQKPLTDTEIQQFAALGDEECKQYLIKTDYIHSFLCNLTYSQIDDYIDNNVTSLATAKEFLKKLSKIVLMLGKSVHFQNG